MTLLNKQGGNSFDDADVRQLTQLAASVSVVLQTWHEASKVRGAHRAVSPGAPPAASPA
jgi:hypothetical protein